jgi:elongation factor Ts
MEITASMVRDLREKTGAPILDCKKALQETGGDSEKATDYLRERSMASVSRKAGRVTSEGSIGSYVHPGDKIGVLVEVNCETDFVSRNDEFKRFVKNMSMHVAAANPWYLKREDVPADVVEKERSLYGVQAQESGKPEKVIERIVDGKMEKFYSEVCLMEQHYVRDPNLSVQDVLNEMIAKFGENISIKRFARFQLGEEP